MKVIFLTNFFLFFLVSPESVVVPIVSCIFGFPIFALLIICCLRKRAKLARERDRQLNYGLQDHAVSLVRFSPIHRLSKLFTIFSFLSFFFSFIAWMISQKYCKNSSFFTIMNTMIVKDIFFILFNKDRICSSYIKEQQSKDD